MGFSSNYRQLMRILTTSKLLRACLFLLIFQPSLPVFAEDSAQSTELKKGNWFEADRIALKYSGMRVEHFTNGSRKVSRSYYTFKSKVRGKERSHTWSTGFPGGEMPRVFSVKVDRRTYATVSFSAPTKDAVSISIQEEERGPEYGKECQMAKGTKVSYPDFDLELMETGYRLVSYSEEQVLTTIARSRVIAEKQYAEANMKVPENFDETVRESLKNVKDYFYKFKVTAVDNASPEMFELKITKPVKTVELTKKSIPFSIKLGTKYGYDKSRNGVDVSVVVSKVK